MRCRRTVPNSSTSRKSTRWELSSAGCPDRFLDPIQQARVASIPANLREIVERNINEEAIRQRPEVENMNATLQAELQKRGLEIPQGGQRGIPRQARRHRLLRRMEEALRRRSVGAA
jgi:hypothetical protein